MAKSSKARKAENAKALEDYMENSVELPDQVKMSLFAFKASKKPTTARRPKRA